MSVEATTVVNFNTSDPDVDYLFNIELDDTLNVETNEAAAINSASDDEGEFQSSPYLQILTNYYYPKETKEIGSGGGIVVDTDLDEAVVITTFPPGSDVYILANRSSNVAIDSVKCTGGSISSQGVVTRSGNVTNLFASIDADEESNDSEEIYTLDIVPSNVDISYIGNTGRLTETISSTGIVTYKHNINYAPFLANFSYDYACNLYKLTPPTLSLSEDESHPIAVVFYITVSE